MRISQYKCSQQKTKNSLGASNVIPDYHHHHHLSLMNSDGFHRYGLLDLVPGDGDDSIEAYDICAIHYSSRLEHSR
ncbi:uncharacterized protein EI90DRAFT_3057965 [Cantharellus anzutake]|uniref:uncharacterized protein n=1 Tax=Cantharellus anzutake TaxID=1750568 RepID=UPI00190344D8|nr:uncharacterized protein EI90DRAFT_3057965 [Cantharellus anzutake]KAF8331444.1 hypothetical protein EI90DRAFT_3057965 [Cantharellus anzutake]